MRKLATAAAVSLALATTGANALILGEIEMRSALNQPIDAEIGLSSIVPGEIDGMIVKLASPEAFARAGIDRTRVLTDLRFNVVTGASGEPVIQVSSRRPILEPFLNFLIDVDWRGGRLVREYTVLLDPPVFMTPAGSLRDTSSETPATVSASAEESILAPVPIDRGTAGQVDESSVALVGEAVEVGNETVSNVDVDLGGVEVALDNNLAGVGEVVEIGGLTEVGEQATAADVFTEESVVVIPGAEVENRSVTLSNPAVAVPVEEVTLVAPQGEPVALNSYNPETGWEVQVLGDSREVPDSVGSELPVAETVALVGEASSTEFTIEDVAVGAGASSGSDGGAAVDLTGRDSEVTVNENDTLWEIAQANSVSGMSTHQMMLALLEANQQAFINNNINLVKAGAVLQIPEASSVSRLSQAQALAQVGEQEKLWREYRDKLRGVQSGNTRLASIDSPATDADSSTEDAAASEETAIATSDAAQKILEQAREEVRQAQNELRIVAENTSTSTVASATADESNNPDTERLGSVNQKLQLAREELAAARLESEELASQSTELENVTSNMDQLVTLQEDKLAKLQAQLADAQNREKLAAAQAEAARTEAERQVNAAADAAKDGAASVEQGAADLAETALAGNGLETDEQVPGGADDAVNAAISMTGADTSAEPIELASATDQGSTTPEASAGAAATDTSAAITAAPVQAAADAPWYQKLDPRYIAGGAGGLALVGLLLMLRRRKSDESEDVLDQVKFVDDENEFAAAGTAAAVGGSAATDVAADMTGENVNLDATSEFDQVADNLETDEFNQAAESGVKGQPTDLDAMPLPAGDDLADDTSAGDDTISEAEVYLAYGLHGQAEDLLLKAVERNPGNAEYRVKLMQTYHAQNNQSAFVDAASSYHEDFGGSSSPDWETIREIGQEVDPSNSLFLGSTDDLESVGKGNFDAPKLDSGDFLPEGENEDNSAASQVREFSSDDASVTDLKEDESELMDQSLDPGFAFDESDLEATGDFTSIADELNQEEAANESTTKPQSQPLADDGIIEFDAPEITTLDETQLEIDKAEEDSIAQDLSMDLEQLSGDMELDSTEILDNGLELTDLTEGGELGTDDIAAAGDVDEMDTMMDLAKAYIDMGDNDSASSALGEIVKSGNPEQKTEAENLLRKIS